MDDEETTTIISTATITVTKTLTQTILSLTSAATPTFPTPLTYDEADLSQKSNTNSLYPYTPSVQLAIIFTILYFLVAVYHGYLSIYVPKRSIVFNKHRYTILLFAASIFSTIGYLIRCVSMQENNISNLVLYTTSAVLIIISPILMCATLYILLTKLITRCLPSSVSPIPLIPGSRLGVSQRNLQKFFLLSPVVLSALFIIFDIISFLTQILGASIAASNGWRPPALTRGTNVILSGLAFQLTTFLLYLLVLHLFCRRVRNTAVTGFNPCIMKVVASTWVASGFILIRTSFRLIEFAMGPNGYAFQHEWCFYVFEAFPVWVALAVLGWWHPIKWIQGRVLAQTQEALHLRQHGQGGVGGGNMIHNGGIANGAAAMIIRKPVTGSAEERQAHYMIGHARKRSHLGNAI